MKIRDICVLALITWLNENCNITALCGCLSNYSFFLAVRFMNKSFWLEMKFTFFLKTSSPFPEKRDPKIPLKITHPIQFELWSFRYLEPKISGYDFGYFCGNDKVILENLVLAYSKVLAKSNLPHQTFLYFYTFWWRMDIWKEKSLNPKTHTDFWWKIITMKIKTKMITWWKCWKSWTAVFPIFW